MDMAQPSRIPKLLINLCVGAGLHAAAIVAWPAPAQAPVIPDLEGRLDRLAEKLEADRRDHRVPAFSIAIVKDDSIIFARGFGLADVENEIPCTEHTVFAAGSTTKAFTATLIGMLVDDGVLDWDDPVSKHLPWFTPPIETDDPDGVLLIRDLLAHRSGFTRMSLLWVSGEASPREILETANGAEPYASFRSRFLYNNVMYLAAGECAASSSGESWRDLMRTRLLDPLGMESATLSVAEAQARGQLALGYRWDRDKEIFERLPMRTIDTVSPAGSLNGSAVDMAQWVRFLLARGEFNGARLIHEHTLAETWSPQINIAGDVHYGLGWMLRDWKGRRLIEHGGNIDGFAAQVALLPEENLGLVFLSNVSYTPLQSQSIDLIFSALLDPAAEDAAAVAAEGRNAVDADAIPDDLHIYEGVYIASHAQFDNEPFTVRVNDEGRLTLDIPSQTTFILEDPDAQGRRPFVGAPMIRASFTLDEEGRASILHLYQGGLRFEVPREGYEFPIEVPLDELERYRGVYRFAEMNADFEVLIRNNHLAVDVPNQMIYELHPPDDEARWQFRVNDVMQIAVEFNERDDGVIESMTLHQQGMTLNLPRLRGVDDRVLPRLEEIVERCRLDDRSRAFAEAGIVRVSGRIRFVNSGIEGRVEQVFDGGSRVASTVDLGRFGRITTIINEDRGWLDISFDRVQELTGRLLQQSRREHPMAHLGDWRRYYDSIQIHGFDTVDGREVILLKARSDDSPEARLYVDLESGDIVKAITVGEVPDVEGMTLTTTIHMRRWRDVESLRVPMEIEVRNEVNGRMIVYLEHVETGVVDDPELFTLNADR